MAIKSPRLGLHTGHTRGDTFRINEYTENWNAIDSAPGTFICTSATRPAIWGPQHAGRAIYETDTSLEWIWDGGEFVRRGPAGLIGEGLLTGNANALGQLKIISAQAAVPPGGRGVFVALSGGGRVRSSLGNVRVILVRVDSADVESTIMEADLTHSEGALDVPLNASALDHPNAGDYTYDLIIESSTGSPESDMTFTGSSAPLRLMILEV